MHSCQVTQLWRTLRAGYTLQTFEGGLLGGLVGSLLTVSFSGFTYQGGTTPGAYAPAIVSPTMAAANDGTTATSITPAAVNLSGVRSLSPGERELHQYATLQATVPLVWQMCQGP